MVQDPGLAARFGLESRYRFDEAAVAVNPAGTGDE